jgi:hypothetical protein
MTLLSRIDTRIVKILLAAAAIAYAVYLFTKGYIGAGIGMVLVAVVLVLAALQSVRMLFVFVNLRQQRMDDARKWLARVNPSHLWPRRRPTYYFLMGSLAMEHNMSDADRLLREALRLGLKQSTDIAMAKLNLAIIASSRRKTREAAILLADSKRHDTKGMLKKEIKQVEQAIKNPQQVRMKGR